MHNTTNMVVFHFCPCEVYILVLIQHSETFPSQTLWSGWAFWGDPLLRRWCPIPPSSWSGDQESRRASAAHNKSIDQRDWSWQCN